MNYFHCSRLKKIQYISLIEKICLICQSYFLSFIINTNQTLFHVTSLDFKDFFKKPDLTV